MQYFFKNIFCVIFKIFFVFLKAKGAELFIIRQQNLREIFISTIYFRTVIVTALVAIFHPLIFSVYILWSSGELVLVDPNKET